MSSNSPSLKEEMDRIRGRVCGLIESWNLPEKQERAAISTFKALTYDTEKVIQNEIIPDAVDDAVRGQDSGDRVVAGLREAARTAR